VIKKNYRIELIKNLCKDKNVLDLGCVDHDSRLERNDLWLHKHIKNVANNLIGVDYLREEVENLKKKGYNIIFANVENFDLNKKFDIIVAGELIEHLENPGKFLDSVKKHMHKDSILIITTPNCFSIRRMIGVIFFGKLKENREHVAY